jgi:hypothetical protein
MATTSVVQQREKHFVGELGRNPIRRESVDNMGPPRVMGVELGVDTPNALRELNDGGSGHGTPPLIGNCATSKGNQVSSTPVIVAMFYICIENHDCTLGGGDLLVVFGLKRFL